MLTALVQRRTDPRPLALTRIGIGFAALILALEAWTYLSLIATSRILDTPSIAGAPAVTSALAFVLFAVWVTAAALLVVGRFSRTAAALTAACGATAMGLDQQLFSNHLLLMTTLCLLLALAQPGAAWSLDARRRPSEPTIPMWPIMLLTTQLATLYLFAGLSKVNPSFLSGEVIATFAYDYVGMTPGLAKLAAVVTVATEVFLGVALLVRRLRPAALVVGFGLHAGIILTVGPLEQLLPFGMLAIATYAVLLESTPRTVVWDDGCRLCRRTMQVVGRLDWLGLHTLVDASDPGAYAHLGITQQQADQALQVLVAGRRYEGYDAVRVILEACPLTFLIAPIMRLRPLRVVGVRAYAALALRRTCAVPERA